MWTHLVGCLSLSLSSKSKGVRHLHLHLAANRTSPRRQVLVTDYGWYVLNEVYSLSLKAMLLYCSINGK